MLLFCFIFALGELLHILNVELRVTYRQQPHAFLCFTKTADVIKEDFSNSSLSHRVNVESDDGFLAAGDQP